MRSIYKLILVPIIGAALLVLASSNPSRANDQSVSCTSSSTTASFQPIGQGPNSVFSRAWDVSANGNVVVGTFLTPSGNGSFETHSYRWNEKTGFQDLGSLNPPFFEGEAFAVSDDGSKVVGWSRAVSGFQRPFLWTEAGGMQELSNVPGSDAQARDISTDGRVIVGLFFVDAEGSWHAFRWNAGHVTDLGFLKGGSNSKGEAVCGSGSAVVGSTLNSSVIQRSFRWRQPRMGTKPRMQDLGGIDVDNDSIAYAEDCSDDGDVAVGTSMDATGNLFATRWSPGQILSLGALGGNSSESHATSGNGSVVVGGAGLPFVNGVSEFSAFRWSKAAGMEQLSKVLESQGVTNVRFCHQQPCPAGTWFIDLALGISPNGSVIVGTTVNPNLPPSSNVEAFRAVVPNHCEPEKEHD